MAFLPWHLVLLCLWVPDIGKHTTCAVLPGIWLRCDCFSFFPTHFHLCLLLLFPGGYSPIPLLLYRLHSRKKYACMHVCVCINLHLRKCLHLRKRMAKCVKCLNCECVFHLMFALVHIKFDLYALWICRSWCWWVMIELFRSHFSLGFKFIVNIH